MNYLSVCSGIEAATVAWHSLGWKAAGFAEIEKFPSAVLKERFPDVTNYGDMTKFKEWENVGTVDLLVGGTPCQSFSVAGLRKGLADPRGNLMLTFGAIAHHFKARWVVWENVPGVLSSNKGRDFGTFLGMLAELGYGFAYRVLDAQFFGVPQRRRRVFVVGCLGSWLNAAKVLFDSESLSGNPPPRRSKGKEAAGNAGNSSADAVCLMDQGGSVMGVEKDLSGTLRAQSHGNEPVVCFVQNGSNEVRLMGGDGEPAATITSCKVRAVCYENHGQDSRIKECGEVSPTLNCNNALPIVMAHGQANAEITEGLSTTLNCNHESPIIADSCQLRRFTPRECERLQGFPDDWTKIPWRNKPAEQCPDGPRYKACGNSMAVPVMRWIGERIDKQEKEAK